MCGIQREVDLFNYFIQYTLIPTYHEQSQSKSKVEFIVSLDSLAQLVLLSSLFSLKIPLSNVFLFLI